MRSIVLVGAVAGTMAITCAGASAATICVPSTVAGCDTSSPTLAGAVTMANAAVDPDVIQIAPGSFAVPQGVVAVAGYPVQIVGSGIDRTVLEATYGGPGDPLNALALYGSADKVSDLTIHESATGHGTSLYLDGATAQRVRVDQRDNTGSFTYAAALQHGASFVDGEALGRMPHGGPLTYGVLVNGDSGQTGRVTNSLVQGGYAVSMQGAGSSVVSRSRVLGETYGVYSQAANGTVDDSTVAGGPILATDFAAPGDVLMVVRHVTLDAQQVVVDGNTDGHTATALLDNNAFVGGGTETTQAVVKSAGTGHAQLNMDYSIYGGPTHIDLTQAGPGSGFSDGGHNVVGLDAKLVDPASGNLRPRFDSPLVDAGDPAVSIGETTLDLDGGARTVNGRTDIGAYEYGRHAPTVDAVAHPSSALVGDQIAFTAGATDADPGEVPTVTWTFDDGTTATGVSVSHAFAAPGTHAATATATDPTGLTARAIVSVDVSSPLLNTPTAPTFGFRRLKARKGVVLVVLACPATATDCAGKLAIQLPSKPKAKGMAARTIVLGSARYAIPHGTRRTIRVKLTRSARARLARARHGLRVRVVARRAGAAPRIKTVVLTGS